jgi:lysophospholipase L1-like esterase
MVTNLTHKRFVILSVINRADGTENSGSSAYNQIVALNAALAAAYPANYIDIRSLIVTASSGTNDSPNNSWTADGLHFTNVGYAFVAGQVNAFLRSRNWH